MRLSGLLKTGLPFVFCAVIVVLQLASCTSTIVSSPKKRADIKGALIGMQLIERTVTKKDLDVALTRMPLNSKVRFIEVLRTPSSFESPTPEYRIFSIERDSIYQIVGLENADILLSIDGYVINSASKIPQVFAVIPTQEQVEFEIIRGGQPLLIRVRIVG